MGHHWHDIYLLILPIKGGAHKAGRRRFMVAPRLMGPIPGAQSCNRAVNTTVAWEGRCDGGNMKGREIAGGPVIGEAGASP